MERRGRRGRKGVVGGGAGRGLYKQRQCEVGWAKNGEEGEEKANSVTVLLDLQDKRKQARCVREKNFTDLFYRVWMLLGPSFPH